MSLYNIYFLFINNFFRYLCLIHKILDIYLGAYYLNISYYSI
jgi:hypothetical protein